MNNKFDNLEEMDKPWTFPRLNHKKIENLNRPITSNEMESVVKSLPSKRS
jgi:hypothetical protein